MTLREKQSLFVKLVARLIDRAYAGGFELTFGETWRHPVTAEHFAHLGIGSVNSLHVDRLAIDLNLFKDGKWLEDTESHRFLGEWWEAQHSLCAWGGHFNDGNHYSLKHQGRK